VLSALPISRRASKPVSKSEVEAARVGSVSRDLRAPPRRILSRRRWRSARATTGPAPDLERNWTLSTNVARHGCRRVSQGAPKSETAALQDFLQADDGGRTRDLRLGKPTLYQLSYVRAVGWIVVGLRHASRPNRGSGRPTCGVEPDRRLPMVTPGMIETLPPIQQPSPIVTGRPSIGPARPLEGPSSWSLVASRTFMPSCRSPDLHAP
jgi:hypothetical protein